MLIIYTTIIIYVNIDNETSEGYLATCTAEVRLMYIGVAMQLYF